MIDHYHIYSENHQDIPSSSWSTTKQVACVCVKTSNLFLKSNLF